jgi:hypothetical protein
VKTGAWVYEWEADGAVCLVFHAHADAAEMKRLHDAFHARIVQRRREKKDGNGRFRAAKENELQTLMHTAAA